MPTTKRADLVTHNYGTIITIAASSPRGSSWLRANVQLSSEPALPAQVDCEHRCAIDIMEGALADGLCLQDAETGRKAVR